METGKSILTAHNPAPHATSAHVAGRNDVRLGDLWEFQIAWGSAYKAMPRGHWIERQQLATSQALGGPSARVFHSLVSLNLASEGRWGADLLMFGGQDASWRLLNDLWHYNDSSSAWTQVVPVFGKWGDCGWILRAEGEEEGRERRE